MSASGSESYQEDQAHAAALVRALLEQGAPPRVRARRWGRWARPIAWINWPRQIGWLLGRDLARAVQAYAACAAGEVDAATEQRLAAYVALKLQELLSDPALCAAQADLALALADARGPVGERAVAAVIAALHRRRVGDYTLASRILARLVRADKQVLPHILHLTRHQDSCLRYVAAATLGAAGVLTTPVLEAILTILHDDRQTNKSSDQAFIEGRYREPNPQGTAIRSLADLYLEPVVADPSSSHLRARLVAALVEALSKPSLHDEAGQVLERIARADPSMLLWVQQVHPPLATAGEALAIVVRAVQAAATAAWLTGMPPERARMQMLLIETVAHIREWWLGLPEAGRIVTTAARAALVLRDPAPSVRQRALARLVALVSEAAATTVARLATRAALAAIVLALDDPDPQIAQAAHAATAQLARPDRLRMAWAAFTLPEVFVVDGDAPPLRRLGLADPATLAAVRDRIVQGQMATSDHVRAARTLATLDPDAADLVGLALERMAHMAPVEPRYTSDWNLYCDLYDLVKTFYTHSAAARDVLLTIFRDAPPPLSTVAGEVLRTLPLAQSEAHVVDALVVALERQQSDAERILGLLVQAEYRQAMQQLLEAQHHPAPAVREQAQQTLAAIWRGATLDPAQDAELLAQAPALRALNPDTRLHGRYRDVVALARAHINPANCDSLVPERMHDMVDLLGQIGAGDAQVVELLLTLLAAPGPKCHAHAVQALQRLLPDRPVVVQGPQQHPPVSVDSIDMLVRRWLTSSTWHALTLHAQAQLENALQRALRPRPTGEDVWTREATNRTIAGALCLAACLFPAAPWVRRQLQAAVWSRDWEVRTAAVEQVKLLVVDERTWSWAARLLLSASYDRVDEVRQTAVAELTELLAAGRPAPARPDQPTRL
jgi:hypothetical protein